MTLNPRATTFGLAAVNLLALSVGLWLLWRLGNQVDFRLFIWLARIVVVSTVWAWVGLWTGIESWVSKPTWTLYYVLWWHALWTLFSTAILLVAVVPQLQSRAFGLAKALFP